MLRGFSPLVTADTHTLIPGSSVVASETTP
jgi:hypothetical protein